jgi:hypothetical protein
MNNNSKARFKALTKKQRREAASIPRMSTRPKVGGFSRPAKTNKNEENL